MKKYILLVLFAFSISLQASAQTLQLSGEVADLDSGTVYLQRFDDKIFHTVDSAILSAGRFSFSSSVELPELYGLSLDSGQSPYYIFLEEGPITVQLDTSAYYRNTRVKGSAAQDRFLAFKQQSTELGIETFIEQDPASIVSAYVLYRNYAYRLTPPEIRQNLQRLDFSLQQSQYAGVLRELASTMETVQPGKKAPDFISHSPEGEPIRLSDHIGRGYLLLDFWAGWCGPCRRENPQLVKAFQQYKDRGFSVFGVSLDKDRDSWINAIEKDGLQWTQVSELDFWKAQAASLYGVRAIPSNFLISPDGEIIARDLKGQELLDVLEKLLSERGPQDLAP